MKKLITLIVGAIALSSPVVWGQEQMTVARFGEIVATPGDNVPLNAKLSAAGHFWTNEIIKISLKYEEGKTFKEEVAGTAKSIAGKYVVTTISSQFYKQPMISIMTYDDKTSAYKVWAIFGETVIEGRVVYDVAKKIYAMDSAYGDGFTELGVGSYTDEESSSKTFIFKNGVLFCTRESKTTPAGSASKSQP